MDQAPTMYTTVNSAEPQYGDGLNAPHSSYNYQTAAAASYATARDTFPVSPATSYEAALLSAPHTQPPTYSAYTPSATHAMEYVHNMYHMQLHAAHDMVHPYGSENLPNLPYGARTIITSDGKRKRRRIITHDQRKAANVRERRRMYHLNEAFDDLRQRVPTFAYEKKLSRIETLKLAVTYIQFMGEMLEDMDGGLSSGTSSPVPSNGPSNGPSNDHSNNLSNDTKLNDMAANKQSETYTGSNDQVKVTESIDMHGNDRTITSRDQMGQDSRNHMHTVSQRLTDILHEISNEQDNGLVEL